uniref:Large ribosomal subunit protein uL23c n=1 Tax=Hommersandiophycus borowitzkae TaxID=268573 RepID=A0A1G4NUB9_9FLOR|nr:Ribosomal protein L23 [Hommersandiophycus borowitzkae]SCW22204.1 Ribosomal protein L23 [Hommersandiophycus borowitzkae]
MQQDNQNHFIDLINKPILTDKTTRILEDNQYCFTVRKNAKKEEIKYAIEELFDVKVIRINTLRKPLKKRRVGKFVGYKTMYKKAIVKLRDGDRIMLFPET